MILSLVAILIVGLVAYLWAAQGVLSALLHLTCTVLAGAIAFAVWEPLVYGLLLGVHRDIAWSVGLLAPFIVSLLLLRIACDKLIPNSIDLDSATNFIGGLALGACAGVISAGMVVVAVSHVRFPPAILGYQPIKYDSAGNLVRSSGLLFPVDTITVRFYETLSVGAFSNATPLATRAPSVHEAAALSRFTYGDKGLSAIQPKDFDVVGRYAIDGPPLSDLLADTFALTPEGGPLPQQAKAIDGSPYPSNARLEGYVVRFKAGAKEKGGQIVLSPGQFRLVVTREGKATGLAPVAAVGRAEAFSLNLARWRFDNNEPYYASVGGASEATFAIEFIVPKDAAPERDLYIKLARAALPAEGTKFATVEERDQAIRDRSSGFDALAVGTVAEAPAGGEIAAPTGPTQDPIRLGTRLLSALNRSDVSGFELDKDNRILNGQATVDAKQKGAPGADLKLRIDQFATTDDTTIVLVDVSVNSRTTLLGRALDAAEGVVPPVLVDNLGQRYEAVGYMHDTGSRYTVRFTPGSPIRGLADIPALSRSRPDEKLVLVFRVSCSVQILKFMIGNRTVEEVNPPIQTPAPRPSR